jgi:hypothetical protein
MGQPVDRLFADRDAFADFFTRYYTDWEPESCLVAEADGKVVGYLLGCLRYRRYALLQPLLVATMTAPKVIGRILAGRYVSRSIAFLKWFIFRSPAETPRYPPRSAHFHINFLPDWRRTGPAREIIFSFLDDVARRGARGVYGQIQTFRNRRSDKLFARYGFALYDRRRVTKFESFHPEAVYVSTFYRRLRA